MESMEYTAFQFYAYVNVLVKKYFCSTTIFDVRKYLRTVICQTLDHLIRMKMQRAQVSQFFPFCRVFCCFVCHLVSWAIQISARISS